MPSRATSSLAVPAVYVTLHGAVGGTTYRLPGPLALVQTDAISRGTSHHEITHVNTLSLAEIADSCPEVSGDEEAGWDSGGRLLTTMSRGGVTVRALTVVAVHAALLGSSRTATAPTAQQQHHQQQEQRNEQEEEFPAFQQAAGDAAAHHRSLMRAAARLTWGLAGLVFELMYSQAGHWPALDDAVHRQAVAGAVMTQLYRLNENLALAVLRAYGQLTPARFEEMLQHGLLPSPAPAARPAVAAAGAGAAGDVCSTPQQAEEACAPGSATTPQRQLDEAAAQV